MFVSDFNLNITSQVLKFNLYTKPSIYFFMCSEYILITWFMWEIAYMMQLRPDEAKWINKY